MNSCVFSGWIPEAGTEAVDHRGRRLVLFEMRVRASDGEEHTLRLRIEDEAKARQWWPLITPGRAAFVRAEARKVPWKRHGIIQGEFVVFAVREMEFPARGAPRSTQGDGVTKGEPAGNDTPPEGVTAAPSPLARFLEEEAASKGKA